MIPFIFANECWMVTARVNSCDRCSNGVVMMTTCFLSTSRVQPSQCLLRQGTSSAWARSRAP